MANTAVNGAFAALWLNERLVEANDALFECVQFFIDNRKARNDQHSLYWSAELTAWIVEFYGSDGTIEPGRLNARVERAILEMMWLSAKETSYVDSLETVRDAYAACRERQGRAAGDPMPVSANIQDTQTWDVIESENHHAMTWMTLWHFTKLLADAPKHQHLEFDDGNTASSGKRP